MSLLAELKRRDRRELVDEARTRARVIDPVFQYGVMASFNLELFQNRIEPARAALAEALRFAPAVPAQEAKLFHWALREPGADDIEARGTIIRQTDYSAYRALRREPDPFFAPFEDARNRSQFYNFYFSISAPVARPLLADPRAKEMLTRFGFVAYWREKRWPALCHPLGSEDFECGTAAGKN